MESVKINSALLVTIISWASAFVGIRIGLTAYSPGSLALLRFLVASFAMALIYRCLPGRKKIPWSDRLQLALLGMAGIGIYNICLNYGEVSVSAGIASFVIGLIPVITIVLSVFFLQERLSLFAWIGILMSFIGLFLMAFTESVSLSVGSGILIILIAAFMGAFYTIMQKRYLRNYHPIAITSWVMWGGTVILMMFAPTLWREIGHASYQATISAIYMGIFPAALGYVTWSYVLNYLPASKASIYLYSLPLVSTFLGFLLLHEKPSMLSLTGGVIALLGAFVATRYRPTSKILLKANESDVDKSAATG